MNFNNLIIDIIKASNKEEIVEPLKDYIVLLNMKNNYVVNSAIINQILKKYEEEIRQIDNIRMVMCSSVGKPVNDPLTISDVLDNLIDHLLSIMCLRYIKDETDEEIKRRMASYEDKELYELLCFVRNKS